MYEDEFTEPEPTVDELTAIEDAELVYAHSPRFWDADTSELVGADPYEHPSWDVADALAEDGWDDPADAAEEMLTATVIEDARLTPAKAPWGPGEDLIAEIVDLLAARVYEEAAA